MFTKMIQRDLLSVEPHLRRMPNGELLCVCTCGGTAEPAEENRVYFWHSRDEGRTWTERTRLCERNDLASYCTEVFVFADRVGAYVAFHSGKFTDWECMMYESVDNGYSWKEVGPMAFDSAYTFMRSGIVLADGRFLMPYQHYPVGKEENDRLKAQNKYGWNSSAEYVENGVMVSRDGSSFEKLTSVVTKFEGLPVRWQWTEPTIAELSDGTLVMLMRYNGTGYLWKSCSLDGGKSWTKPTKTDIPNPDNKPQLIRLDEKRIALLNTPCSISGMEHRFPLELWISEDNMKSWSIRRRVCEFDGCYSYPSATLSADGKRLLIAVDFNRHDVYFLETEL